MKIEKKKYGISWKTAFVVVLTLHMFGYIAISQYSSYRAKIAKSIKEARETLYSDNTPTSWPQEKLSPKILSKTVPKPTTVKVIPTPTPKPIIVYKQPKISNPIKIEDVTNKISSFFSKKESHKFSKNIQVVSVPKSITKPIETEIYTRKTISKPFVSVDDIPVRRATPVNSYTYESRQIVSSRIVLQ